MTAYKELQRLKSYRHVARRDLIKQGRSRMASISNGLRLLSAAEYAETRNRHLVTTVKHTKTLPHRFHLAATLAVAVAGAIITSAGVQTLTLPLPRLLRLISTPILAGVLVVISEELARHTITTQRLRQSWLQERDRLTKALNAVDEDYPLEKAWRSAMLELLDTVEGRPWPTISVAALIAVSVLEGCSAFYWAVQDSFMLAIFAAAAPTIFILLAALLLSRLLDGNNEMKTLAAIYEDYTAPQDFAPELSDLAEPNLVDSDSAAESVPPPGSSENGYATKHVVSEKFSGHDLPEISAPS